MKLLNKLKDKVKSMLPKKDSLSVAGINIPIIPFNLNRPKHKTVPAPSVLKDGEWFGPAVISDANRIYLEQKEQEQKNILTKENKEPDNIHEVMYNMAVKNASTTLDLDPINIGGSENYGDAPGRNWNSGG